ncbi:hypothetical protein F5148DRAFT_406366 [Russula earlei]|uniref:Uncharacterized protein n=1 Tax=Russula earlei TaxID=71964 RepID=A0ACC0UJE7_9AGAM|nr:hypothetical protein F5148DRAFT_406366 [Russula earlei]
MMGDVIEISPSPEMEPRTFYRPLRRKRIPLSPDDGNESAIELTDSTDSQRSTPCRRVKRFKEAAEPTAGPSASSRAPVEQSSPRVIMRKHKRGQTPASRQASAAASRRPASPVQKPHVHSTSVVGQEQDVIPARPLTPPATPDSPQLVNRQLTPPPDVPPVHEQLQEPRRKETFVAAESHERLVERVREVVPDVLPAHVFELLASHEATFADNLLNAVIHVLLEDRSYPRDVKGKGKARAPEERTTEASGDVNTSVDYSQLGGDRRLGPTYRSLSLVRCNLLSLRTPLTCMEQNNLRCNFPDLDQAFIRETLSLHEGHYAPTYLYLLGHGATPASIVPVAPSLRKRKSKVGSKSSLDEEEFVKEHTWLVEKLENQHSPLPGIISQDVEGEGEGIECGCCFSSYPFVRFSDCDLSPH